MLKGVRTTVRTPFEYALFANKQHAQCISSAVGGNGAACAGDQHLIKQTHLLHLLYASVNDGGITAGVSDENAAGVNVRAVTDAVRDILLERYVELTTVLLADTHLALSNHDAGLQTQQVGTKGRNSRATATLM